MVHWGQQKNQMKTNLLGKWDTNKRNQVCSFNELEFFFFLEDKRQNELETLNVYLQGRDSRTIVGWQMILEYERLMVH